MEQVPPTSIMEVDHIETQVLPSIEDICIVEIGGRRGKCWLRRQGTRTTPSNAGTSSDTSRTLHPNTSPRQTKPPYHVFTRPPHSVPVQTECALQLVDSAFEAQTSAVNL
ncbi:hypothetical protein GY45DRAFT_1329218 [Cubamyces sp. BRFM 1775]|nr:hypothetical protein GY45DRAFT_1329218 [Cubamyces sp. BRFM 1775]